MLGKFCVLFSCLICFLVCSCEESNKTKIKELVEEWNNKKIVFQNDIIFTKFGIDTMGNEFTNVKNKYSIMTYIDSIGCVRCNLNLMEWQHFIKSLQKSKLDCKVLFFIHPRSKSEIKYLLKKEDFSYPVCIDIYDSINKLNHFPSDIMFQTFLLNKDNRVVAIGNPIQNPKVKELYIKIIKGEDPMLSKKGLQTSVTFDKKEINLETFNWKQGQVADFILTNTGNELLVIEEISTSCGCTTVEYSKEPIQPGKSLNLKVKYKADHPEYFNKTITVYCNAKGSPFQLKISGNAELGYKESGNE